MRYARSRVGHETEMPIDARGRVGARRGKAELLRARCREDEQTVSDEGGAESAAIPNRIDGKLGDPRGAAVTTIRAFRDHDRTTHDVVGIDDVRGGGRLEWPRIRV